MTSACICRHTPRIETRSQFWLLTHADELRKPTNSGRLIAASIPSTRLFVWRDEELPELSALLREPQYEPYLVYPFGREELYVTLPERVAAARSSARSLVFVLLDGTWDQARRMFRRSECLRGLPHLTLPGRASAISNSPRLRQQHQPGQLSTAETAVALLNQVREETASRMLAEYYDIFASQAFAARRGRPIVRGN